MWCLSDPRRLVGVLLLPLVLQATRSAAGPAVNVALKASFDSAPFLVELLETAAEENSTSYFPLLDRIATGYFEDALTDEKLYNKFLDVLKEDGHFTDPHSLSSFQFALSIHSAAPRIEAFYQYYNGSVDPLVGDKAEGDCFTWLYFQEKRYCSPTLEHAAGVISAPSVAQDLPFDRVLNGGTDSPASILYADISSPEFRKFHSIISQTAKEGQTSYRVRHRPSAERRPEPLYVNGYGVELALKRTDYIVIDDRDAPSVSEGKTPESTGGRELDEEAIADLKPLSSSEVLKLGLKAASFALTSDAPFDTLKKISQDFPKYSSMIAAHEISNEFMTEFSGNRELFLPAGYSIIWINGVQVPARDMNAFSLLEQMRRERKLVNALRDLGLSPREAVDLLSHPAIAEPKANNEPQRYDWRDTTEGGNAIIWLNDLEKDKRYDGWPNSVLAIMQKTYPGQLPNVRRDIHNVIVFVDLSKSQEMALIVEQLQNFVKRGIPIRWGIVPLIKSEAIKDHSKIIYHLTDTYGLATALQYLKTILDSRKLSVADESTFNSIIKDRKLRKDKVTVPFRELFQSSAVDERVEAAKNYAARLGVKTESIAFANGAALPMGDNWLSTMGTRVSADLRTLQQAVYEHEFEEEDWLPQLFLDNSTARRNPLIIPADEDGIKIIDASLLDTDYADLFDKLPRLEAKKVDDAQLLVHLLVIADMRTENGLKFISEAIQFHNENENIEVVFLDNPVDDSQRSLDLSEHLLKAAEASGLQDYISKFGIPDNSNEGISQDQKALYQAILKILDMEAGQDAVVMNGRFAGPIDASTVFVKSDFAQLLEYETIKRLKPAYTALNELELTQKITTPFQAAKLTSIVALSQVSDAPEGIFESASSLRLNVFNKWNSSSSAIVTGDAETASIHIVAAVDPASEIAQRWIPILHVLSELDGVHLKLFPNPREKLQELPVKRFYRHVLESKPTFHEDGSLQGLSARFGNLPEEALLTAALDVPPAWLVAPKESPYDLDNIKISGLKDRVGDGDIEAIYELQYILIEGHSRDVTTGQAPRGVQLVLGTEKNKHHADTIIMANLGYFQFKGNPGLWRMDLQEGRNKDIYNLDSAGSMGYAAKPGDESTEIALTSFQGVTLFPRLSRKAGQEEEDVLEVTPGSVKDYVSKGLNFAEKVLTKVGLQKEKPNADINIFSVASGHLYERMLNIMMVSVMKHTKHSVKFWFIEQFLSPSFKDFIPILAEEYGFSYEMVTYKWPHWLRGQKEKQREIWGYKILFLDVLFPLSLDKVIFVDADQIVRTDMYELVTHDLQGAPYGFTPMCDSRTEMEGFRFWKQGYWANFLRGLPYHISALYVVDLKRFRQIAAGDRLRQQYHQLSADPNSLSNLDQDLPNHMQQSLPIHSLPQEWLWCETWCSDESLKDAKTIDLCNNPLTKEPKLDRARRQVPEWTVYDDEIAAVAARARQLEVGDDVVTESITTTSTVLLERTPSQPPKKDEL